MRPCHRSVRIGLDDRVAGTKDEKKRLTGKSRFCMFLASNRSAANKLLSFTLLISVSAAPLFSMAAPCHMQGRESHSGGERACNADCCTEQSSSCCGSSSVRRVCNCSQQPSPPAVPTQRPSSPERGEHCWATETPVSHGLLDCNGDNPAHPNVVISSSWPTTRLQVVLCRWLT